VHYGWVVLIVGIGVMCACLGIGRFALGMLLPSMGQSLHLNYSQMGLVSTANFTGYMISVVFAPIVSNRVGPRAAISLGLTIVGLSMAGIWAAADFLSLTLLYIFTGVGSGLANIPMMGLVAAWFVKRWRGRAAGFMLVGNGLGIILSGFLIPRLNLRMGELGWRYGWLFLGAIVLVIAFFAAILLRNSPDLLSLRPMGSSGSIDPPGRVKSDTARLVEQGKTEAGRLVRLGLIYSLFGATYAVYATFIVTTLVNQRGFSEQSAGTFWSAVGILSLISGLYAGYVADRFGRFSALTLVFTQFTVAHLLALSGLPSICLYLSVVAFGLSIWGVPTIMTAAVGDIVSPERAASAFAFITIFFGVGQVIGPAAAGYLAEVTGLFDAAFAACALLTGIGAAVSASLRIWQHRLG